MRSSIDEVCRIYFNGFSELGNNQASGKDKFIAFCKVVSYFITLGLLPLGLVIARQIDRQFRKMTTPLNPADASAQHIAAKSLPQAYQTAFTISSQESTEREDADSKDRDKGIASAIFEERSLLGALCSQSIPDEIVKVAAYQDACNKYKEYILSLPLLPPSIKELAAENMATGNAQTLMDGMERLKNWKEARDTLVVWNKLAALIRGRSERPSPFLLENTWQIEDAWIEKSKEFCTWYNTHQAALGKLSTLTLSGEKLSYLPREIENLCQLKYLNLSHNQLASWPKVNLNQLEYLDLSHNPPSCRLPKGTVKPRQLTLFLDAR